MHINWQKTLLITLDVALATYLGFAFTKFNKPDEKGMLCTKVNINIEDEMTNGFLNAKEIKKRLEIKKLYPTVCVPASVAASNRQLIHKFSYPAFALSSSNAN